MHVEDLKPGMIFVITHVNGQYFTKQRGWVVDGQPLMAKSINYPFVLALAITDHPVTLDCRLVTIRRCHKRYWTTFKKAVANIEATDPPQIVPQNTPPKPGQSGQWIPA